jgi:hypothetical protein
VGHAEARIHNGLEAEGARALLKVDVVAGRYLAVRIVFVGKEWPLHGLEDAPADKPAAAASAIDEVAARGLNLRIDRPEAPICALSLPVALLWKHTLQRQLHERHRRDNRDVVGDVAEDLQDVDRRRGIGVNDAKPLRLFELKELVGGSIGGWRSAALAEPAGEP